METANAIRGMKLSRARRYLKHVIERTETVPILKYKGGVGRNSQAKHWGVAQGKWPRKSARFLLDLLRNAGANAEMQVCIAIKQSYTMSGMYSVHTGSLFLVCNTWYIEHKVKRNCLVYHLLHSDH